MYKYLNQVLKHMTMFSVRICSRWITTYKLLKKSIAVKPKKLDVATKVLK